MTRVQKSIAFAMGLGLAAGFNDGIAVQQRTVAKGPQFGSPTRAARKQKRKIAAASKKRNRRS